MLGKSQRLSEPALPKPPLGSSRHIESHTHFRFRGQAWCVAEGCQWGQCCAGSHPAWQHDDPGPESPCLLTADPGPSAWPLITMLGRPVRTACWGAPAIAAVDLHPVLDTGLQLLNWASFPSQKWVDAPSAVSPVNMEESVNPTGWGWPSMGPPLGCTPPPQSPGQRSLCLRLRLLLWVSCQETHSIQRKPLGVSRSPRSGRLWLTLASAMLNPPECTKGHTEWP